MSGCHRALPFFAFLFLAPLADAHVSDGPEHIHAWMLFAALIAGATLVGVSFGLAAGFDQRGARRRAARVRFPLEFDTPRSAIADHQSSAAS